MTILPNNVSWLTSVFKTMIQEGMLSILERLFRKNLAFLLLESNEGSCWPGPFIERILFFQFCCDLGADIFDLFPIVFNDCCASVFQQGDKFVIIVGKD